MVYTVVKQINRADKRTRLTIVLRPDGNFFYREDTFEEWDDAPPFWLDGHPPSGIFGTAEEADRDARSSLAWLRE